MKLEAIQELWDVDSKVERDRLDEESLKISVLHSKYHKILTHESLLSKKLEADMKILVKDKYEFYTMGPTPETHSKGWKLPPQGKIIKQEVDRYMDSDPDIIELSLKIGVQKEKTYFLESIIRTLNGRSYNIRNTIDYLKFINGG